MISDLRLPGMSGLDLAKKLRRGRHAQPVIIVTAYGSSDTLRELREAGIADCFSKPFRMDHLRQAVHQALAPAPPLRVVPAPKRSARPARAARVSSSSRSTRTTRSRRAA